MYPARQGKVEKALAELEKRRRIQAEHRVINSYGEVTTLNNFAEVRLWMAEQGEASERSISLKEAKSMCWAALKAGAKMRAKQPKAMRLQGTCEWLCGKPAAAQKWWHKSLAEAERMGLLYDAAMTQLEMGHRLQNRAHLEKAEAIFIYRKLDVANRTEAVARARQFELLPYPLFIL